MDIRRTRPDRGSEWGETAPFLRARTRIDQARARAAYRAGSYERQTSHPDLWDDAGKPRLMDPGRHDPRWLERDMPLRRPGQQQPPRHRPRLAEATAAALMTTEVIAVQPDASLLAVAALMRRHRIGMVPIIDADRKVMGVLTDRDIVVRAIAQGRDLGATVVADVMSRELACVDLDAPASQVVETMARHQVRRIPVVDDDARIVGIVSLDDLALRADDDEQLQRTLARTAARRSFWRQDSWR
jgi:CBS domain-containing protein